MPQTIYGTADTWGNVTEYHTRESMLEVIESLKDVGFEDISLVDCQQHNLIKTLPDGTAAYHGAWLTDGYNSNGRHAVVVFKDNGDGSFKQVLWADPNRDADELAELGIE
jgi:hypothetical protein